MKQEEIQAKYDSLMARLTEVAAKKQRMMGQLEAQQGALKAIVAQIHAKGLTPETLPQEVERIEAELLKAMAELEAKVKQTEDAINTFEVQAQG